MHKTKSFSNRSYIVKIHTPGIQRKEQIQIYIDLDDQSITITATGEESTVVDTNTVITNNLPTMFKVDIKLPRM